MQSFKVDTAEIGSASTNMTTIATNIETNVAAMMRALTTLETTWTGSAAAGFTLLRDDWKKTQDAVKADLVAIGTALKNAGVSYDDVETANTRNLGGGTGAGVGGATVPPVGRHGQGL